MTRKAPRAQNRHLDSIAKTGFSDRLARLLNERGLTQSDLARLIWGDAPPGKTGRVLAKNRDRISKYLQGTILPDGKTVAVLAAALRCQPEDLIPPIVGSRSDRENPELSMTIIAGHRDKVHLTINVVVDLCTALEMASLLQNRPPNAPPPAATPTITPTITTMPTT
jgi:transcriptional regulator with XRE-family HTH domain